MKHRGKAGNETSREKQEMKHRGGKNIKKSLPLALIFAHMPIKNPAAENVN